MITVNGDVIAGEGDAGRRLSIQIPLIQREFPEIQKCYRGTINLQLERGVRIEKPDYTTVSIQWSGPPGEVFSFVRIKLEAPLATPSRPAWIYLPHNDPHRGNLFQAEVIAEWIGHLDAGSRCRLHFPAARLEGNLIVV